MATVSLRQVSKKFGAVEALRDVSLDIVSGEFVTLLGPSGCGKSTTLRIMAGLTAPDDGSVWIGDEDVTRVPTYRRRIGMVFQNLALFPHLTVGANVAFGLRMRHTATGRESDLVASALEMVRLAGLERRYPSQLSGGQQQRVALARAVVFSPDVILLDEPLAALDRNLREAMQQELRELTRRIGITAVFVTHDQEEALILSDRVVVMNQGVIEQIDTPAEVFDAPRTRYVADFMGVTNLFEARVRESSSGRLVFDAFGIAVAALTTTDLSAGDRAHIGIRPERIELTPGKPEPPTTAVEGVVESALYHGTVSTYQVRLREACDATLVVRQINREQEAVAGPLAPGTRIWASWTPEAVYVMAK
jgi:spermidine/putrescine ABC transporter ATP-binding subunit